MITEIKQEMADRNKRSVQSQRNAGKTTESQDQSSCTNMSTIGNTSIPPTEREMIHDEVRAVMRQNFPGIQFGTVHNSGFGILVLKQLK